MTCISTAAATTAIFCEIKIILKHHIIEMVIDFLPISIIEFDKILSKLIRAFIFVHKTVVNENELFIMGRQKKTFRSNQQRFQKNRKLI